MEGGASAAASDGGAAAPAFGWVPAEVVRSLLEDVGNFRARASAIELLHATVLDVEDCAVMRPSLSAFLAFLLHLVADVNFKISISAMNILEDVVARLGPDVHPYLGTLIAPLTERLGDSMQLARQAAARAIASLTRVLGPQPVLAGLGSALMHQQWRVREEAVNAFTTALLSHPKERFDYPICVRLLAGAAADSSPRVAGAALEAFALLHARLGTLLQGLLTAVGAPEGVKRQVADRIRAVPQLGLPMLDSQGHLQHLAHARPASAQRSRPAAAAAGSKTVMLPAHPLRVDGISALPGTAAEQQAGPAALPGQSAGEAYTVPAASQPGAPPAAYGQPLHTAAIEAATSAQGANMLQADCALAADATYGAGQIGSSYSFAYGATDGSAALEQNISFSASLASCSSCAAIGMDGQGSASTGEKVERSEGSLLNWVLPPRRSSQQSFTSTIRGSTSFSSNARSSATGPVSATRKSCTALPTTGGTVQEAAGAMRSLLRANKSTPSSLPSSKPAQAAAPVVPTLVPSTSVADATANPSAYRPDLYTSVLNWKRQQSVGGGPLDALQEGNGLQQQGQGQGQAGDGSMAVEPRSDSLLQWRLPPRAPSSTRAAAPLQQQPAAAPAPQQPPARVGSASFKQTLTTFRRKLFGGDAEAGKKEQLVHQAQQIKQDLQDQQPGSPGWSISTAVCPEDVAIYDLSPVVRGGQPDSSQPAKGGGLTVVVPEPAALEALPPQQQQPESPGKVADRLGKLKLLTDRRRVWSAPTAAHHQDLQPIESTEAGASSQGGTDCVVAAAPDLESLSAGSPGNTSIPRSGLQALKARARTARLLGQSGGSSSGVGAGTGFGGSMDGMGGSGMYSMEAVDAVFGPDKPIRGWEEPASPLKSTLSSASSSPKKLTVLTHGISSGGMQWPDSPTGCNAADTPSTQIAGWRGGGFVPEEATSPKATASAGNGSSAGCSSPTAADISPLPHPEAALQQALSALEAAAPSQKKELDWQAQHEALRTVRRLARHHADVLLPALHALVPVAAPVIDALRSTMSRLAIAVFQELAEALGPSLDAELDNFVPLLSKRAGQVSVAGRDNFLAVEADRALAAVVEHAGEVKVAAALLNCLVGCKSPDVRAKAALHLDTCLQQHGATLVSSSSQLAQRLLRAAVGLLDEGGQDGRTAGKRMLWELRRLLDGGAGGNEGGGFRRALARLDCKTDKVWEVLDSGRMPPPPARLQSAGLRPSGSAGGSSSLPPSSASPTKQGMLTATSAFVTSGSRCSSAVSSGLGEGGSLTSSSTNVSGHPSRPSLTGGSSSAAGVGAGVGVPPGSSSSSSSVAPGKRGSRPASSRLGAASAAIAAAVAADSVPAAVASLEALDPEVQQQLEAAEMQMGSGEWKERLAAVEAVQKAASGQAAQPLPLEANVWLAGVLSQRVLDPNLKVQQQSLAALNCVIGAAGEGLAAVAPSLVPAVCKCLDSNNPSVRQAATEALDAVLRCWSPAAFLPPLMTATGSVAGGARGKAALLDRLANLGPVLWHSRPVLVQRHVLPALFSLLTAERRPELRQMVQGVLAALGGSMGAELMAAAKAARLPLPQQQLLAGIVQAS